MRVLVREHGVVVDRHFRSVDPLRFEVSYLGLVLVAQQPQPVLSQRLLVGSLLLAQDLGPDHGSSVTHLHSTYVLLLALHILDIFSFRVLPQRSHGLLANLPDLNALLLASLSLFSWGLFLYQGALTESHSLL